MSTKNNAEFLRVLEQAQKTEQQMFEKAGTMIELMKRLRSNALSKRRAYRALYKAVESGNKETIASARARLADIPKLNIKI